MPHLKVDEELKEKYDKSQLDIKKKQEGIEEKKGVTQTKLAEELDYDATDDFIESYRKGKIFADEQIKEGPRYLDDPRIKNILRTKASMAEGFDSEKIAAETASARRQIRGSTQSQVRKLGSMHARLGLRGGAAAAQQGQAYAQGAGRMAQFEEGLVKAQFEAKRKGQNEYANAYTAYKDRDVKSMAREEAMKHGMANTFSQLNAAQKTSSLNLLESELNRLSQEGIAQSQFDVQADTAWLDYVGGVNTTDSQYHIAENMPQNRQQDGPWTGEDWLGFGLTAASTVAMFMCDESLKNVEGDMDRVLDLIKEVNLYKFTYKQDTSLGDLPKGTRFGPMAQEVQKVLPEAVVDVKEGYLGLDPQQIIWTLFSAVKELNTKVEKLTEELKKG